MAPAGSRRPLCALLTLGLALLSLGCQEFFLAERKVPRVTAIEPLGGIGGEVVAVKLDELLPHLQITFDGVPAKTLGTYQGYLLVLVPVLDRPSFDTLQVGAVADGTPGVETLPFIYFGPGQPVHEQVSSESTLSPVTTALVPFPSIEPAPSSCVSESAAEDAAQRLVGAISGSSLQLVDPELPRISGAIDTAAIAIGAALYTYRLPCGRVGARAVIIAADGALYLTEAAIDAAQPDRSPFRPPQSSRGATLPKFAGGRTASPTAILPRTAGAEAKLVIGYASSDRTGKLLPENALDFASRLTSPAALEELTFELASFPLSRTGQPAATPQSLGQFALPAEFKIFGQLWASGEQVLVVALALDPSAPLGVPRLRAATSLWLAAGATMVPLEVESGAGTALFEKALSSRGPAIAASGRPDGKTIAVSYLGAGGPRLALLSRTGPTRFRVSWDRAVNEAASVLVVAGAAGADVVAVNGKTATHFDAGGAVVRQATVAGTISSALASPDGALVSLVTIEPNAILRLDVASAEVRELSDTRRFSNLLIFGNGSSETVLVSSVGQSSLARPIPGTTLIASPGSGFSATPRTIDALVSTAGMDGIYEVETCGETPYIKFLHVVSAGARLKIPGSGASSCAGFDGGCSAPPDSGAGGAGEVGTVPALNILTVALASCVDGKLVQGGAQESRTVDLPYEITGLARDLAPGSVQLISSISEAAQASEKDLAAIALDIPRLARGEPGIPCIAGGACRRVALAELGMPRGPSAVKSNYVLPSRGSLLQGLDAVALEGYLTIDGGSVVVTRIAPTPGKPSAVATGNVPIITPRAIAGIPFATEAAEDGTYDLSAVRHEGLIPDAGAEDGGLDGGARSSRCLPPHLLARCDHDPYDSSPKGAIVLLDFAGCAQRFCHSGLAGLEAIAMPNSGQKIYAVVRRGQQLVLVILDVETIFDPQYGVRAGQISITREVRLGVDLESTSPPGIAFLPEGNHAYIAMPASKKLVQIR